MGPEALEGLSPVMERPDRLEIGAIKHLTPLSPYIDQADIAEHFEVLRNGRLAQVHHRDDIADGPFARRKVDEDVAPARFRDGIEDVGGGGGARHQEIVFPLRNM